MNARWTALALLGGSLGLLSGCGGGGDSADPPLTLSATSGDARSVLSFAAQGGVEYWVFVSTSSNLTRTNPEQIVTDIDSGEAICGLRNGSTYYLGINGREGGGEGGDLSSIISVTPRPAGDAWSVASLPAAGGSLNGLAYMNLENCRTIDSDFARSGKGRYVALGDNGSLLQSEDGKSWSAASLPAGFASHLYAATGYTRYPAEDAIEDKELVWVAVGADGAVLYTVDAATWKQARAAAAGQPALRSVANAGYDFIAVGDGGTVLYSDDGEDWSSRSSGVSANLNAVAYGSGVFTAVGDGGVLLTSDDDGDSWSPVATGTGAALNAVTYGNFDYRTGVDDDDVRIDTFVAVGNGGTVMLSRDGGDSWQAVNSGIAANLVAVSYTTRFIALDEAGNAYTSTDGLNWAAPVASGSTAVRASATNGGSVIVLGSGNLSRAD